MLMIVYTVLFITGTFAIIYIFNKLKNSYWKKRNVPFLKYTFPIGSIWEILTLKKTVGSFVLDLHRKYKSHPYVGFFVMDRPALLIRDANMLNDILIKDFNHFEDNWYTVDPKVDFLLWCSPFVQKGKHWKSTRAIITPQFTGAKVKTTFSFLENECKNMVKYIEKAQQTNNSDAIEVTDLSARFTANNVMLCGYGLEAKAFEQDKPEIFKVLGSVDNPLGFSITMKRTLGLLSQFAQKILNISFVGDPIPSLFKDIIKETVNNRQVNQTNPPDFLNYLIELKNRNLFGINELAGHAFTMYLDGFQTSFSAMAYCLLELALNQDVQNHARNEILRVVQKYDGKITYEAVQELQYVRNVLFETLRLHPIIKFMTRECTKQYVLQNKNDNSRLTIEKGTLMFISVRGIHYDSAYYVNPEKFDPDRFSDEVRSEQPKCSFLGFGEGPRICLGRRFGIAQVVAGLATILLNFDLTLNKKTKFPIEEDFFHISDVPISGLHINFIRRTF